MEKITLDDVKKYFQLSSEEIDKEVGLVRFYSAQDNKNVPVGNKLIYHCQIEELLKCRYKKKTTFVEMLQDDDLYKKMVDKCDEKPGSPTFITSLYNTFKFLVCPVTVFKTAQAKHIYTHMEATHVLDPTSGWGGRMLGAQGIKYTGFDTNIDLEPGYKKLCNLFENEDWTMNYRAIEPEDYELIDYDCVLTSPPYCNLEIYNHFTPFPSEEAYYRHFLIPMINNSRKHIKRNGKVCINVSPEIYDKLTTAYQYPKCNQTIELKQSGAKKIKHQIYIWYSGPALATTVESNATETKVTKNPMIHAVLLKLRDIIDILLDYY